MLLDFASAVDPPAILQRRAFIASARTSRRIFHHPPSSPRPPNFKRNCTGRRIVWQLTSSLEGETATYSRLARGARAEAHTATSLLSILSRKSFLLLFFLLQFPSDRGLTLCRRLLQLETLAVAGPLISCFLAGYICQENIEHASTTCD